MAEIIGYQQYIDRFAELKELELPLQVGQTVKFRTEYGTYPGEWTGIIKQRMMPNPYGFINSPGVRHVVGEIGGHYEVAVFLPVKRAGNPSLADNMRRTARPVEPDEATSYDRVLVMASDRGYVGGHSTTMSVSPKQVIT